MNLSFAQKVKQAIKMIRYAMGSGRPIIWFEYDRCICHNNQGLSYQIKGYCVSAFHTLGEEG
jgi:hypothetical protein